ncbi:uncharacterized protein LOC128145602 isoform X2 [Harpia harpyja]|uniref:uncharacterized protein LOC128145602 isoform X2 n=1 Tax=Harpia harpyja TaxID=202280 RepID=UPI0022B0C052|nr:uncharacterized protein LOC128145602 isoform X2 [Harpia harpyja]
MPLTAAASGLRGLSLPGLPLLAARERRGAGGALTGCGQELRKLERPQKAGYGHVASERGYVSRRPHVVRAVRRSRVPLCGGQPSDGSSRRRREERRRKKRLSWQGLLAAPRARAVLGVSWHHFAVVALSSAVTVGDRWKDSVVVCKYKLYSPNKPDAKQQQQRKGCSCCGGSVSVDSDCVRPRPAASQGYLPAAVL